MEFLNFIKDLLEARTKTAILLRTIFIIIVISYFFIIIFLSSVLQPIQSNFSINQDILIVGVIGFSTFMIYSIIVNSDNLANTSSKNRFSRAFQKYWPSIYIAEKYNIDLETANYIWFDKLFNGWSDPKSERHEQWKRTFDRGYQCRFVYYSQKVLCSFSITSIIWIGGEFLYSSYINKSYSIINLAWKIIFFVVVLLSYLLMLKHNSVHNDKLKGVWQKYGEINKLHIKWIDENPNLIISELGKKKN